MAEPRDRSLSPQPVEPPHPRALVPVDGVRTTGVLRLFEAEVAGAPRPCVLLNGSAGLRAFVNVCAHRDQPVALSEGPLEADGTLLCDAHGARYEVERGECVEGPCIGDALRPVPLVVEDGWWCVAEDPVDDSAYALEG